ncbi:MAG: ferredoxin-thioredoxin reductase catalytic domain-containing protein [Angelakisella sp.]
MEYNTDLELVESIKKQLSENGGYCPCAIEKTEETKCMCKNFREMAEGICHCGLYIKTL